MVINWYTIITEDVDLLSNFLTTLHSCLQSKNLWNPLIVDDTFYIFSKLRIFQILRVGIDWIHGRITFLIGTLLFQTIEATSHLFRTLCLVEKYGGATNLINEITYVK